jgi:HK97 family phage prohead protease
MKENNQRVTSEFTIQKGVKLEYGEVEVVVSNSGTDRHGESIIMEGIDTKQISKNPVVLWGHDYSSLPIGKITKLWKSNGNLMARIKLANELYDFADKVYKMIKEGIINAVSIGGIVKEWNDDYTIIKKMEMVELSVVPVGAHPDALVTAKSLGIEENEMKQSYKEFLTKSLNDKEVSEPVKRVIRFTY